MFITTFSHDFNRCLGSVENAIVLVLCDTAHRAFDDYTESVANLAAGR